MGGIKVRIRNKDQANVVALFNVLNSLTFFVQQIGGNRYRQLGFDLAGVVLDTFFFKNTQDRQR